MSRKLLSIHLFLLTLLLQPATTHAFNLRDWFWTKNQQGQELMEKHRYEQAQHTFTDQAWQATAAYKAGNYSEAAKLYETIRTGEGYYNLGNALAHLGKYEEAIQAYDQSLQINPKNMDAEYNKKLLEDLLKQDKEKQDQQDQQKQDQQKQDQQKQDQQKQDQQKQDQQMQSQNEQEKKAANQQWLKLIPDDPGGLLRQKFLRDYLKKQQGLY